MTTCHIELLEIANYSFDTPIEALLTMTQTMTMCSAFEHFMNGKGAI